MAVDLVFSRAPLTGPTYDLVFNEGDGGSGIPAATVDFDITLPWTLEGVILAAAQVTAEITLPPLTVEGAVHQRYDITGEIVLSDLTVESAVGYETRTQRPLVGLVRSRFQDGMRALAGVQQRFTDASAISHAVTDTAQEARQTGNETRIAFTDAVRFTLPSLAVPFQEARQLTPWSRQVSSQEGIRLRSLDYDVPFQEAMRLMVQPLALVWQEGLSRRDRARSRFQEAQSARAPWYFETIRSGMAVARLVDTRFQEAMRPPPGLHPPVIPPEPPEENPCYVPPRGDEVHLVFQDPPGDTHLVFVCETHTTPPDGETIVVPIRGVYIVNNSAVLKRVDGDIFLPTLDMRFSLDYKSWTWGFSATLPAAARGDLMPDGNEPVEVDAEINGVHYRFIVEDVQRSRSFNQATLSVTGRGKSAVLGDAFAAVQTFRNTAERTAQQLVADVLTDNGVPMDWTVEWNPEDWTVPANIFNHQGTYITALLAIAEAAGAYIQPHPTAQTLRFMLQYPVKPWEWGDVVPDYELPSNVTTTEGIRWMDKAKYNRVFVSGVQAGVIGQITRTGTDGLMLAPPVVNPLITTGPAAQQRGIPVLADTGRQAHIDVKLPVLAETGIILPGKFVRYTDPDEGERIGLVRGVNVESQRGDGPLENWQTLTLETHE